MRRSSLLLFVVSLLAAIGPGCRYFTGAWACESDNNCPNNRQCVQGECVLGPADDADAGGRLDDGGAPGDDAGTPGDDASAPNDDAGSPKDDGGPPNDDAGPPDVDAGSPADGGVPPEDGGAPIDGGDPVVDAGFDAGPQPCQVVFDTALIVTTEAGTEVDLDIVLSEQPDNSVTFQVEIVDASGNPAEDEATVDSDFISFDDGNWEDPETVTITGQQDTVRDGSATYFVRLTRVSGDSCFVGGQLEGRNDGAERSLVISDDAFQGDFGGAAGADAECPSGFSAVLHESDVREQGGPDWVLLPDTAYFRLDGTYLTTTDDNARFSGSSGNWDAPPEESVVLGNPTVWTGMNANMDQWGSDCDDWTSDEFGDFGRVGDATRTGNNVWSDNTERCSTFRRFICVEDP